MGMVVKGEYKDPAPTLDTDGQYTNLRVDEHGNLCCNVGDNIVLDNVDLGAVVTVQGGDAQGDPVEITGTVIAVLDEDHVDPVTGVLLVTEALPDRNMVRATVDIDPDETEAIAVAVSPGESFCITKVVLSCHSTGTIEFADGDFTGQKLGPKFFMRKGSGWSESWDKKAPWTSSVASDLVYNTSEFFTGSLYYEGWFE